MKSYASKFFAALLAVAAMAMAPAAHAVNWVLAYEHSATGAPLAGSLATLAKAVNSGASVKIVMVRDDQNFGNHSIVDLDIVGVTANGSMVYATSKNYGVDVSNGRPYFQTQYVLSNMWRTDGSRDIEIYTPTGQLTNETQYREHLRWYVSQ